MQLRCRCSDQQLSIKWTLLRCFCNLGGGLSLQARTERTDIGTLLIPEIKMSDSGTYMCVGSNSIGSNSSPIRVNVLKGEAAAYLKGKLSIYQCLNVFFNIIGLYSMILLWLTLLSTFFFAQKKNVFYVQAADHSSEAVTIQPSIADVQEGQSLELNCFAPRTPPSRVIWTRANGHLSANHQVTTQTSLNLLKDTFYYVQCLWCFPRHFQDCHFTCSEIWDTHEPSFNFAPF